MSSELRGKHLAKEALTADSIDHRLATSQDPSHTAT